MRNTSVLSTLRHKPSDDLLARLELIDAEDFGPVIKRTEAALKKDGKRITLSHDQAVVGLRQYYGLIAVAQPSKEYSISGVLDPYWHSHVLDTRSYADFCRRCMGYFVHHVPLDDTDETAFQHVAGFYLNTGRDLREMFALVSDDVFPREATAENVICLMYKGVPN